MITVLTGDNSFELAQALEKLTKSYDGELTRVDGEDITLDKLIELTSAASLFSTRRMVVIRELAANKALWTALGERLGNVDDEVHLVLVEPSLDKRTATYKRLQKAADVQVFAAWSDRDSGKAETWTTQMARQLGVALDTQSARMLVARVGMDQWGLYHALEKLAVVERVDAAVIEALIEAQPSENVFNLLDAALNGKTERVHTMIQNLQRSQDPYMTFGLLSGQVFQLAALSVADKSSGEVGGDIGAHPYALGKLAPYAKKLGRARAKKIVMVFAAADTAMKSTAVDPWLLVEESLVKTASI